MDKIIDKLKKNFEKITKQVETFNKLVEEEKTLLKELEDFKPEAAKPEGGKSTVEKEKKHRMPHKATATKMLEKAFDDADIEWDKNVDEFIKHLKTVTDYNPEKLQDYVNSFVESKEPIEPPSGGADVDI